VWGGHVKTQTANSAVHADCGDDADSADWNFLLFLFLLPWFAEGVYVRFTFCHAQRSMEANNVRQSKIPEEFPQKDLLSPVGKIPHLLI